MNTTRTGGFPIGFRRGWTEWQKDTAKLASWAGKAGFAHVDVGRDADVSMREVRDAGLDVGSVDMAVWNEMLSADAGKRREAVARNTEYVKACGPVNYFIVMLPEDPALPPATNFGYMVESFGELSEAMEVAGAKLVIEGWPGPGALCCTPESYRAFFRECPSESMGVNYDPSHLIRMGIDPLRFASEFAGRVHHVHAKDAEILSERLYELGTEVPSMEAPAIAFGGNHWRYTIAGHGRMRWSRAFQILADAGYQGRVSVELEDADFNDGTAQGEQRGLVLSLEYLRGA